MSGASSISVSLYFEYQELYSFEEDFISLIAVQAMLNHTICRCLNLETPSRFMYSTSISPFTPPVSAEPLATLAYVADSACTPSLL